MEPVFNFVEMFERSIGLKEPWKVTRAEFNDKDKSVHVYIEAKKTSKYPCPECHKMCRRYGALALLLIVWFFARGISG